MDFQTIDLYVALDLFLLLLIGIGPKIALVPYLTVTDGLSSEVKGRIARKMLIIAGTTAVVLVLLGEFLTRILHFSPGALGIAGGVILFIIATRMILGGDEDEGAKRAERSGDPMSLAAYPLAVPYLLNPAGIVVLVTFSGEVRSFTWFGLVIGLLALVLAIDVVVFRWANQVGARMNATRMLVIEKVFGFLLAAVGVQLALDGLHDLGVIHLTVH